MKRRWHPTMASLIGLAAIAVGFGALLADAVIAGKISVHPDKANAIAFEPTEAKFVRLAIVDGGGNQTCIDELEVYAEGAEENLALADKGAKATASSCYPSNPSHRIAHLNDGRYGNNHSWIPAGIDGEWAQIELPEAANISKVVFSRDRTRHYTDRIASKLAVQVSVDAEQWRTVKEVTTDVVPTAVVRRTYGFAGVVPNPGPPPKRTDGGVTVVDASEPFDAAVPKQDDLGFSNLALNDQAKAATSSALSGYEIHKTEHLNDGLAGNNRSWIAAEDPSWAEIDLGATYWVYKVAFGSDSSREYRDRAPSNFAIFAATEHNADTKAKTWKKVYQRSQGSPVLVREEFKFKPVEARWIRVQIEGATSLQARIDELEVYGQLEPIPLEKVGPITSTLLVEEMTDERRMLEHAFLGEEQAWLKTYGYADVAQRLLRTPYRDKVYPEHVEDDIVPLPATREVPKLDGDPGDAAWAAGSRGVVRVVAVDDFQAGPLVEYAVTALRTKDDVYLRIQTDRLLSNHVAVVSAADGEGCGLLLMGKDGLLLNTYEPEGRRGTKLVESKPAEGGTSDDFTCFEVKLPLERFAECAEKGLRVGLGMGGRHTVAEGRAVNFAFSPLSVQQVGPCRNREFRLRFRLAEDADGPIDVHGNAGELSDGIELAPGRQREVVVPAQGGAVGPEAALELTAGGESFRLRLLRYDPLQRPLEQMEEMLQRYAAEGIDVAEEQKQHAELRRRQSELLEAAPDLSAEREALYEARASKRRLFFRQPKLKPVENILFVKRQAFRPSHNYSVLLDGRWAPGGSICLLKTPTVDGRLEPTQAKVVRLFESGSGVARNPMANFDLSKIYFGYRESREGYYHIMRMDPDGSNIEQLTDGPFHDYWPCPLPDGGIAFISTRCRARFLCWRPQAAVLFRMENDGTGIRPLSFANLTEWGPSVMSDGRIIWQRSEYQDKGADYSHTLWAIRPDGTKPELVFGNTILLPQGYANGREVPGTNEILCTLISHFGDLNGPLALLDLDQGRYNKEAITSITPEVPWPGYWPVGECFRDPFPVSSDYYLCSYAPAERFGLAVVDRFGNRELLYLDWDVGSMCPTLYRKVPTPPVLHSPIDEKMAEQWTGQFAMSDVYQGLGDAVPRGKAKYLRVAHEVRANLIQLPDGSYQDDHSPFMHWYATPVDVIRGPFGWPSYVAKGTYGTVPIEEDGSANFLAPAGKVLYFQVLDENYNELQRMRSVVQLQPGEQRSCIGCHEDRRHTPVVRPGIALRKPPRKLEPPPWGAGPLAYEEVVQPVLDKHCVSCHDATDKNGIDLSAVRDENRVPASYRTLITQGWVHYLDWGYQSGGNEKVDPLTYGTVKSKLFSLLDAGHHDVKLSTDELRALKCWVDLNCPLWPDYKDRKTRPGSTPPGNELTHSK